MLVYLSGFINKEEQSEINTWYFYAFHRISMVGAEAFWNLLNAKDENAKNVNRSNVICIVFFASTLHLTIIEEQLSPAAITANTEICYRTLAEEGVYRSMLSALLLLVITSR